MVDAASKESLGGGNPFECAEKGNSQVFDRVGTSIGQFFLGEFPHSFVGIEFGRVGRKQLEVQTRMTATHRSNRLSLVDRCVVPYGDHRATQMPEQLIEKQAGLDMADVGGEEFEVEIQMAATRAHRNAGNHGDLVPARFVAKDRRLSRGSPCLAHAWEKKKPGFVYEDEVGTHPRGVFFTSGQRSRFHCSMPSSFRSSARRAGF